MSSAWAPAADGALLAARRITELLVFDMRTGAETHRSLLDDQPSGLQLRCRMLSLCSARLSFRSLDFDGRWVVMAWTSPAGSGEVKIIDLASGVSTTYPIEATSVRFR